MLTGRGSQSGQGKTRLQIDLGLTSSSAHSGLYDLGQVP